MRLGLACVLMASFAAGPVAQADARTSVSAGFRIPTVEGQEVDVDVSAGWVTITASAEDEAHERFEAAIYEVSGTMRDRRLVADLGRFGSIAMRFKPRHVHRSTELGCKVTRATGVFVGRTTYAGEGTQAAASATRASGHLATAKGQGCRVFKRNTAKRSSRATVLTAVRRDETTSLAALFSAMRIPHVPETIFMAEEFSAEGRVFIVHLAYAFGDRRSFTFNRDLTRAAVAPPAPFSGTANYARTDDGRAWGGNLTVGFLGLDPTPLTGSGIRAHLRRLSTSAIALRPIASRLPQGARYAGK
jgi:hypothetical protein